MSKISSRSERLKLLEKIAGEKVKVRARGTCCLPADHPQVLNNTDHYPINNVAQARNALARVKGHKSVPPWFKGTLSSLVNIVQKKVKSKYPSIEVIKKADDRIDLLRKLAQPAVTYSGHVEFLTYAQMYDTYHEVNYPYNASIDYINDENDDYDDYYLDINLVQKDSDFPEKIKLSYRTGPIISSKEILTELKAIGDVINETINKLSIDNFDKSFTGEMIIFYVMRDHYIKNDPSSDLLNLLNKEIKHYDEDVQEKLVKEEIAPIEENKIEHEIEPQKCRRCRNDVFKNGLCITCVLQDELMNSPVRPKQQPSVKLKDISNRGGFIPARPTEIHVPKLAHNNTTPFVKIANKLVKKAKYDNTVGQNYDQISTITNSLSQHIDLAIDEYSNNRLTLVRNHLGDFNRSLQEMSGIISKFIQTEYTSSVKEAGIFDFFKKKPVEYKEPSFEEKHKNAISSFKSGIWETIKNSKITLNKLQNLVDDLDSTDKEYYKSKLLALKQLCEDYHIIFVNANKDYFIPLLNIKSTVDYKEFAPINLVDYKGKAPISDIEKAIPNLEPQTMTELLGKTPATKLIEPNYSSPTISLLNKDNGPLSPGVEEDYKFAECPCGSGKSFVGCHGEDYDRIKKIILKNKRKELNKKFSSLEDSENYIDEIMNYYEQENIEFWIEAKSGTPEYKELSKAEMEYFRYLNLQAAKKAEIEAAKEEQRRQETVSIRHDKRNRLRDFFDNAFSRKAV